MILTLVNVVYLLVAVAMVVLILMQRGSGAAAGAGFGGGASATVFGSRGSANFLSSATKWLAVVFFVMSLGMAWNASRDVRPETVIEDIGVMGDLPTMPDASADLPAVPGASAEQAEASAPVAVESAPEEATATTDTEKKSDEAASETSKKE